MSQEEMKMEENEGDLRIQSYKCNDCTNHKEEINRLKLRIEELESTVPKKLN